jgi:hypothetical protein
MTRLISTARAPDDKTCPNSRRLERQAMLGLGDAQLPAAHEDVHMSERLAAGQDYNLAELVGECAIATNTARPAATRV